MATQITTGYPVLIIGAGRGGTALLEMFQEDNLVNVVAIVDTFAEAPGLALAKQLGIPAYTHATEALQYCKERHPDCIIYNLSHDDGIAEEAFRIFGDRRVSSGHEVQLFWQMVTNLKRVKGELEKSQNQLQSIISNAMDGIITITEDGFIEGFNPAAEQIFGYTRQEVMGQNIGMLMPETLRTKHEEHLSHYHHKKHGKLLAVRGREVIALHKEGRTFPLEVSVSEMSLGGRRYFIGIVRDITDRKAAEQKIAHLAHYDYLTDLPNRALFLDILSHSIALSRRNGHLLAVLFLDLDGFKKINDTLGHDTGDLLLKGVAERLGQSVRRSDTVSRVGGDEFILVLDNIQNEKNAKDVANKIIEALAEPFVFNGQTCRVGASIGISLFPENSDEGVMLVKQADEAMYLAKQSGKNTCRFYRDVQ